jgi:hypothetical protein
MPDADDVPAAPIAKPSLKQRLSALFAQYGRIAIITFFTLSILTIIGFSIAFGIGASPSTATGVLGVIAAGWVAAKATLPIRILITLGLTPVVAFVVTRLGRKAAQAAPAVEVPGAALEAPDVALQAPDDSTRDRP